MYSTTRLAILYSCLTILASSCKSRKEGSKPLMEEQLSHHIAPKLYELANGTQATLCFDLVNRSKERLPETLKESQIQQGLCPGNAQLIDGSGEISIKTLQTCPLLPEGTGIARIVVYDFSLTANNQRPFSTTFQEAAKICRDQRKLVSSLRPE